MRHEDAALALWLATDPAGGDRSLPCQEVAAPGRACAASRVRKRAGSAVITLGEWLAGEPRNRPDPKPRRRPLAGHAS